MMRIFLLVVFLSGSVVTFEEPMKCNIKTCGTDLLNFKDLSFGSLIRKFRVVIFCVRQCSPPIVHEFLESIGFAINKRIPGVCNENECSDHNRFISLSQCVEKHTWPLIRCGFRMLELIQITVEKLEKDVIRNKTCSTIMETTQCVEESLQKCGRKTFSLVKEIFSDVIEFGASSYCHKNFQNRKTSSAHAPTLQESVSKYLAEPLKTWKSNTGKCIHSSLQYIITISSLIALLILH